MINKRALEKVIKQSMERQFAAQMREYLVFVAPKEITEMYKAYVDECEAAYKRRVKFLRYASYAVATCVWVYIFLIWAGRA